MFGYQIYDSCGSLEYDAITSAVLDVLLDDVGGGGGHAQACPCTFNTLSRIVGVIGKSTYS